MITLYSRVDISEQEKYYFTDLAKFITALTSFKLADIQEDNYKLNDLQLKILNGLTLSNFESVNFILETDGDYNRFYYVERCKRQSGYFIYDLKIDLWHSYIYKADISKIFINRCNRKLTEYGIFDTPAIVKNPTTAILTPSSTLKLAVAFKRTDGSYNDEMVVINCTSGVPSAYTDISNVIYNLSRIAYLGIPYESGSGWSYADIKISNVYLLPANLINYTLYSKTRYLCLSDQTQFFEIAGGAIFGDVCELSKTIASAQNYNKLLMAGVNHRLIKIDRNTGYTQVYKIRTYITTTQVITSLIYGTQEIDISDAFKINISSSAENLTSSNFDKISKAINVLSGITGVVNTAIKNPANIVNATGGLASDLKNQFGNATPINTNNAYVDALTTYEGITDIRNSYSPFIYKEYEPFYSYDTLYITQNGATFNYCIDSIESVFNNVLLYGIATDAKTFIKASLHADKIPHEASAYIESAFNNGVYLTYAN